MRVARAAWQRVWDCPDCGAVLESLDRYKSHLYRCWTAQGFRRGARVMTPEGPGVIVGTETHLRTDRGPGLRRFRVQLDQDQRVRHYPRYKLELAVRLFGLPREIWPLPSSFEPYALLGTGSRTIFRWPERTWLPPGAPRFFVHGAAQGADRLLAGIFEARGCVPEPMPADWTQGLGAGHRRNAEMLRMLQAQPGPRAVLALWDGSSPGTRNMICRAMAANVPCFVVLCR